MKKINLKHHRIATQTNRMRDARDMNDTQETLGALSMTQDMDVAMNPASTSRENMTQNARPSALSRVRSRLTRWASVGVVMSGLMLPVSALHAHHSAGNPGFDQNLGIQDLVHEGVSTANKQAAWANPTESSLVLNTSGGSASVGDSVSSVVNPLNSSLSFEMEDSDSSNYPVLRNDSSSGFNYLEFDGSAGQPLFVDTGANLPASSTLNLFYLVEPKTSANFDTIIGVGESGTPTEVTFALQDGSFQLSPLNGNITLIAVASGTVAYRIPLFPTSELVNGERHLITMSMNPSTKNTQVFLDGELKFDAALDSSFTEVRKTGFYRLFGNRAFTSFMRGDLYEMMLFENLTDNDVEVVNGYLLCKWGIAVPPGAAAKSCAASSANPDTDTLSVRLDNAPQPLTNLHVNDAFQPLVGLQTTETQNITPVTANASLTTADIASDASGSTGQVTYVPHISEMGKTVTYTYQNVYSDSNETDVESEVVTNSIIITQETDNTSMIASHEQRLIGDDVTVTATLKDTTDAPYPDGTTIAGFFTIDSGNGALSTADCVVAGGAGECSSVLTNASGADGDVTVVKGALNDVVTIDTKSVTWLEPVTTVPLVDAPLCNPSTTLGGWTGGTPPQGTTSATSSSDDGSVTSVWTANQSSNLGSDLYPRWPSFGSTADGGFQGRISTKITGEQNLTIAFDSSPGSGYHFRLNDFSGTENATITAKNASGDTIYPQYTSFTSGTVFSGANLNTIWANGGSRLITFTFAEPVTEIKLFDVSSTAFITLSQFSCPPFVLTAEDDDYTATPIDSLTGGTTANVVANDTLTYVDGTITGPTIGTDVRDVTLYTTTAQDGTTALGLASGSEPSNGSITMGADGSLVVAAGTTDGTYDYTYQICDATDADNCETAVATVVVTPSNVDLSIAATTQAAEDATNGEFTFTLDKALLNELVIPLTLSGTATDGTDMSAMPTSVTIPAGQTSVTLPVTVTADSISEADETVIVTITTASVVSPGVSFNVSTDSATVTITDDDVPAAPVITQPTVDPSTGVISIDATGTPGNTPTITDASGNPIPGADCAPSPIPASGEFTCTLPPGTDPTSAQVGQTNANGPSPTTTPAAPAGPAAPTVSGSTVNTDGSIAVAATGVPGNKPVAIDDSGNPITGAVCAPDPIGADGAFTCTLPTGTDMNDVNLTQTDNNGQTSGGTEAPLPAAPTAPAVSGSTVNTDGSIAVAATGVPGNKPSVVDDNGDPITGAVCAPDPIGADGAFTCTLPTGTDINDVNLTQADNSGQTSGGMEAPLPAAPTAPAVSGSTVNPDGSIAVAATGVPGNKPVVVDDSGNPITGAVCAPDPIGADGAFTCTLPTGTDMNDVNLTQTDNSGQTSGGTEAPLPAAPTAPAVSGSTVNPDGSIAVAATGVPGNKPSVVDDNGDPITGAVCAPDPIGADGAFTCTLPTGTDMNDVNLAQTDTNGQTSGTTAAPLPAAPTAPTVSGSTVNPDGSIAVAATGLPGNKPAAIDDSGNPITGAVCAPDPIGADGAFTCTLPTGTDMNDVNLAQTDTSGQTSGGAEAPLPAAPTAPAVSGSTVNPDGSIAVAATGIPGNKPAVVDDSGNPITGAVCAPDPIGADGAFTCTLPTGTDMNDVNLTQTDNSGQTSGGMEAPLPAAPTAPAVSGSTVNPDGSIAVAATGIPGNKPAVVDENGDPIAGATCTPDPIGADGAFTCTLPTGTDVSDVNLTQTDTSGQTSEGTDAPLPAAPTAPAVDGTTMNPDGSIVVAGSGGVPGNTPVAVDENGNPIAGAVCTPDPIGADGTFSCTLPTGTDVNDVSLAQTDPSGQTSGGAAAPLPAAPTAPAVDGTTVNPDGSIVVAGSGGVPGNTPVAIDGNGDPITGAVCTPDPIGSDGKFTCTLPTGTDVNNVNLAQTDPSGQTSGGAAAPLPAAPTVPAVSGSTVNPDGSIAVAATGIPGNKPSVVDEDGNPITGAVCTPDPIGADGAFTCTLPVGTDVNDVSVTQTDPSGQTSAKTAAPLPTGPAAPETEEPSINDQGETEITVKPTPVPGNRYSVTDKDGNVIAGATCSPDPVTSASDVVTCTLPAGTEGPVKIMATDPSGQSASSQPIELDDNDGVSAEDEKAAVEELEKVLTAEEAAALGLDQAAVMPNMAVLMDKPNADAKGSAAASPLLVQAPASGSACGTPKFTSMKLIQEGESGIAGGQGNVGVTYSSPDSTTYDFPHGLVEFQLECANKTVANGEKSTVNLVFTGLNPDVPLSAYEIVKLTVNGEYKPAANVVGVTLMADDSGLGVADQEGKVMVVTVEVQDDSAEGDFVTAGDHEAAEQMKLLDPIGPAIRTSAGGVTLDKRVNKSEAAVGDFVRYTLVLEDTDEEANDVMEIADFFPHKGLNYVTDSAKVTVNGTETDATVVDAGKTLSISGLPVVPAGGKLTVSYLAQVNAAASGEYVNKARAGGSASVIIGGYLVGTTNEGTATVKVGEDPILDKLTVIGKVFDDANANGVQDDGEMGIPGARLVTLKGQIITTDSAGRYHVPAVSAGQRDNGRNFYIKLDVRSLSNGYEVTTENPMVQRITPGLMSRINFGVRQAAPAE